MINATEKKLRKIKDEFGKIDLIVPGTVRTTYLKCGKTSCACWKEKSARHGPYYFWDRKVNGKLSSKSINKDLVPILKAWIKNRKKAEDQLGQMIILGQKIAFDYIENDKK